MQRLRNIPVILCLLILTSATLSHAAADHMSFSGFTYIRTDTSESGFATESVIKKHYKDGKIEMETYSATDVSFWLSLLNDDRGYLDSFEFCRENGKWIPKSGDYLRTNEIPAIEQMSHFLLTYTLDAQGILKVNGESLSQVNPGPEVIRFRERTERSYSYTLDIDTIVAPPIGYTRLSLLNLQYTKFTRDRYFEPARQSHDDTTTTITDFPAEVYLLPFRGFSNNPGILKFAPNLVNTRNLNEGEIDKSVAIVWDASHEFDMTSLLVDPCNTGDIIWEIDRFNTIDLGTTNETGILEYSDEVKPDIGEIIAFNVKATDKRDSKKFDEIIIVIYPKATKTAFEEWYAGERLDKSWLLELPAPYSSLDNARDDRDPEPDDAEDACAPQRWGNCPPPYIFSPVCDAGQDYHPDPATFEMRSEISPGGHGHQAIYRIDGTIIPFGVSAGSADKGHWTIIDGENSHRNLDVNPFVWAAQLDANPVACNAFCSSLSGSLMYEGSNLEDYLEVRPSLANGEEPLAPGMCENGLRGQ